MPTENIRERVEKVAKMGQEPKDRLWAAIFVLTVLVLAVGILTVSYSRQIKTTVATNSEFLVVGGALGHERGAVECLQVVIDNDRNFDLPPYCSLPEVVIYYPPQVCEKFYPDIKPCGSKWPE